MNQAGRGADKGCMSDVSSEVVHWSQAAQRSLKLTRGSPQFYIHKKHTPLSSSDACCRIELVTSVIPNPSLQLCPAVENEYIAWKMANPNSASVIAKFRHNQATDKEVVGRSVVEPSNSRLTVIVSPSTSSLYRGPHLHSSLS